MKYTSLTMQTHNLGETRVVRVDFADARILRNSLELYALFIQPVVAFQAVKKLALGGTPCASPSWEQ